MADSSDPTRQEQVAQTAVALTGQGRVAQRAPCTTPSTSTPVHVNAGGCGVTITIQVDCGCGGGRGGLASPPPTDDPTNPPDPELPSPLYYDTATSLHAYPLWANGTNPHHYQHAQQGLYKAGGQTMSGFMFSARDAMAYKYGGFGVSNLGLAGSTVDATLGAGWDSASSKQKASGAWAVRGLSLKTEALDSGGGTPIWKVSIDHTHAAAGYHQLVLIPAKVGNYGTSHDFETYKSQAAVADLAAAGTTDLVVKLPQPATYYAFAVGAPSAAYGVEKDNAFGWVASAVLVIPAPS